eukprot:symbB.v1.2.028125.t1/scaffold2919.1/size67253/2
MESSSLKRPVADPEGPILELLRVYKIQNAPGYYEGRIRGKFQRLDHGRLQPHVSAKATQNFRGPNEARKGKDLWKFKDEDFEPLRLLWKEYIRDLKLEEFSSAEGAETLLKSIDLHGSRIEVVSSKQPNLLRLQGTVIEETQRTFRIMTCKNEVKMIPKENCVFEVLLPSPILRLRFFGPHHQSQSASDQRSEWKL